MTKTKPNEEKHAGGRPLTYNEDILSKSQEYLDLCQDTERSTDEILEPQSHGGALKRVKNLNVKLPTRGGLAKYLKVRRETLYDWAKKYPEFSNIMELLGSEQEDRLINNGLSGDYNPTIAKVLLTKHGYNDKVEQEHSGEQKLIVETRVHGKDNQPRIEREEETVE